MSEVYKMTIAGLERELPLCPINENLSIGAFIIFGDVELTVAASAELLKKCPEFDYIITPEAKSIPLAYEMNEGADDFFKGNPPKVKAQILCNTLRKKYEFTVRGVMFL